MKRLHALGGLAATLFGLGATAAEAPTPEPALPLWEAGLATGLGHVPDYPGADRARLRGIVLPMFVYRGPVLRVDENGIRGRLLNTTEWEFDLSATGAFNATDNDARAGMPALDYLFGVGPQWIYKGWKAAEGRPTLHLKARALMSTDLKGIDARGFSFDPELRWRWHQVAGTPASLGLSVQPTWASERLHRYYYEVSPLQATAARPAFDARGGYLGTELAATVSHRPARDLSWFVTARYMSLHGSANTASPLLRERGNFSVGAGLVWTPWRSSRAASD